MILCVLGTKMEKIYLYLNTSIVFRTDFFVLYYFVFLK